MTDNRVHEQAAGGETLPAACRACPWRTSNHGKKHPDGWFTQANRRRLWSGLRRGEMMSCHPTDPDNPVSDKAAAAGYKPAPAGAETRECVGATVLVQREAQIWSDQAGGDIRRYRVLRPLGLLRDGITQVMLRIAFGDVPFIGGRKMLTPDLNHDDISAGFPGLDWSTDQEGDRSD